MKRKTSESMRNACRGKQHEERARKTFAPPSPSFPELRAGQDRRRQAVRARYALTSISYHSAIMLITKCFERFAYVLHRDSIYPHHRAIHEERGGNSGTKMPHSPRFLREKIGFCPARQVFGGPMAAWAARVAPVQVAAVPAPVPSVQPMAAQAHTQVAAKPLPDAYRRGQVCPIRPASSMRRRREFNRLLVGRRFSLPQWSSRSQLKKSLTRVTHAQDPPT